MRKRAWWSGFASGVVVTGLLVLASDRVVLQAEATGRASFDRDAFHQALDAVRPHDAPPTETWLSLETLVDLGRLAQRPTVLRPLLVPREEAIARIEAMGLRRQEDEVFDVWVPERVFPYEVVLLEGDVAAFIPASEPGTGLSPLAAARDMPPSDVETQLGALLAALDDGRFEAARFDPVDAFFRDNLRLYDGVVANSYLAWRDYELWDAYYRVWVAALQVGTYLNGAQLMRHLESGDRAVLERSRQPPFTSLLGTAVEPCRRMVDDADAWMQRFGRGEITAASAAAGVREVLHRVDFCPSYWRLPDPQVRTTPPYTMLEMVRAYLWYHRHASPEIRELLVGFGPLAGVRHTWRSLRDDGHRSLWRSGSLLRDAVVAWNRDWQRP
ncbi:MAG: hypothetical protein KDK70_26365 [Myxococcales bacterium]|nr:hypothetical protein [Myxococcales bacterium]